MRPPDRKQITRSTVGRGVREIRIRDAAGAFRVLYVAKFDDAVYVLHCFQKKSVRGGQVPRLNRELIEKRWRDAVRIEEDK